jgi:hypothetical protein
MKLSATPIFVYIVSQSQETFKLFKGTNDSLVLILLGPNNTAQQRALAF